MKSQISSTEIPEGGKEVILYQTLKNQRCKPRAGPQKWAHEQNAQRQKRKLETLDRATSSISGAAARNKTERRAVDRFLIK